MSQREHSNVSCSIQDKLGRQFREGLLKAAQTTGAWIITAGVDSGVVRHVARALDEAGISTRSALITLLHLCSIINVSKIRDVHK